MNCCNIVAFSNLVPKCTETPREFQVKKRWISVTRLLADDTVSVIYLNSPAIQCWPSINSKPSNCLAGAAVNKMGVNKMGDSLPSLWGNIFFTHFYEHIKKSNIDYGSAVFIR